MFIAALFTIAKTWKPPQCPSTEQWIKIWYVHTMEYYSAIKKNEIMPFAVIQMDLEITILSEVSQRKYHMISLIFGIIKDDTNGHFYKKEIDLQIENKLTVSKG